MTKIDWHVLLQPHCGVLMPLLPLLLK